MGPNPGRLCTPIVPKFDTRSLTIRYALINGERREAAPQLSGECPNCGAALTARCGDIRVWHWAHAGRRMCDAWWEPETEWHRAWKNHFPVERQEIHYAADGERHIADVKTRDGWVLEFQHSRIAPEERLSREAFYGALIWVVDGTRRAHDRAQFRKAWAKGREPIPLLNKRVLDAPSGALFRDWVGSRAHVFFDFGDGTWLWWLFPGSRPTAVYLEPITRDEVLRALRAGELKPFDDLVDNFRAFVARFETPPPPTPRPVPPPALRQPELRLPLMRRSFRF